MSPRRGVLAHVNRNLKDFWTGATPEQAAQAPGLIARYMKSAERRSKWLSFQYNQLDAESCVMYALYKAAYTFRPGKASFLSWLNKKIFGETGKLRRQLARKSKQGIKFQPLDVEELERRIV